MAFELDIATGIKVIDGTALDKRQNRYTSKAAALIAIPLLPVIVEGISMLHRYIGLTVPVIENGRTVEYWFELGTADVDFVLKTVAPFARAIQSENSPTLVNGQPISDGYIWFNTSTNTNLSGRTFTRYQNTWIETGGGVGSGGGGAAQDISGKLDILVASTTGTVLTFTNDRIYGSKTTPETGSITGDITGAKLGVTNVIIHNNVTSLPSFDVKFKKLSGSGNYLINVINYIFCMYVAPDEIIYSIQQRT